MTSEPRKEWMQLYDDRMLKIWQEEKRKFRKIAMIHYAFDKELERLKHDLEDSFVQIKTAFKQKDDSNKRKKFTGLAQSERFDLDFINLDRCDDENKTPEPVPLPQHDSKIKTEDFFIESPDTHAFKFRSPSPQKRSKMTLATSPILRKISFTRPNRKNISSPAILNPFSFDKTPKVEKRNNLSSPSILNPCSLGKAEDIEKATLKRKKSNSPTLVCAKKTPRSDEGKSKQSMPKAKSKLHTPLNFEDSNIMESSIIEDTPDSKPERKSKRPRLKSKLNRSNQANTLTQMFLEPKQSKREFDSKLNSMTVTEMLDYINVSSGSETDQSDETVDGLEVSRPTPDCSKACTSPEKRKNVSPEKSQTADQSRIHRPNPIQETYDGFWDLTFGPTPKSQEEQSMVFNYKKNT